MILWAKERTLPCPGRHLWSTNARWDYVRWCEELHLDPVNRTRFGIVIRDELKIEKDDKSGRAKYLNVGLRPAALRVVSRFSPAFRSGD